jgi:Taurine catabolism dioxygenase TauD, TfdA family
VSDFRRIHREIEPETRKILETRPYIFQSKPQDQEGESRALVPIHSPIYDPGRPIYRYSTNYIARQSSDNDTKKLVADIGNLHAQLKISIALKRGDVLVVNNHHMLHSRTEFSDPNRLLVRAWATTA